MTDPPIEPQWGSDLVAQAFADLGFDYLALNPGASFRALHDSVVNFGQNQLPKIVLCLHEEHAVAIAHGYAKVSGRPMLVAVHTAVGLMHASMAIFNAYCDRVPVVILGAQGPLDASIRRPWIDWIHTAADQAALIRPFIKWDDEPHSVAAGLESLQRAAGLAMQSPRGPVYVTFDSTIQEALLTQSERGLPRRTPMNVIEPIPDVRALSSDLARARRPVFLMGRVGRSQSSWAQRTALAELTNAKVVTDLRVGAAFPTTHRLHVGPPGLALSAAARDVMRDSDFILAFDWVDLAGSLKQAGVDPSEHRKVGSISPDSYVHNGWTKDHQGLFPTTRHILGSPDRAVEALVTQMRAEPSRSEGTSRRDGLPDASVLHVAESPKPLHEIPAVDGLSMRHIGEALNRICQGLDSTIIRLPIGWPGDVLHFHGPLDYLGSDGGGGIGSGPGMAVGAALALKGTGRIPIAILGDGDFLMGSSALWSAVSEGLGLLVIVANNRSYFTDVLHQEQMAIFRGRPVGNKWVGQRIDDPPVNIAGLGVALGATGVGPINDAVHLEEALIRAFAEVSQGRVVVVDTLVAPALEGPAAPLTTRGLCHPDLWNPLNQEAAPQ